MTDTTKVYPGEVMKAIAEVMNGDLYVQKRGNNKFHGYKYATVGDLLDKLQPLMARAGLVVLQSEVSKDFVDNGNVLSINYEFTLAHSSGSVWPEHPVITGMTACRNSKGGFDDKAANKCHTAARKYFLLGLFQVPTGEDYREPLHDGDADGQEDQALPPKQHMVQPLAYEDIVSFETDLVNRLSEIHDLEALDELWRNGVSAKLREIGQSDKDAKERGIRAFAEKKRQILEREKRDADAEAV